MILFRLLNPQGIAGLAAAAILGLLLVLAKIDARHSKRQSAQFEQLYRGEIRAHAETVANVRIATERARASGARVLLDPREGPAGWRSVVRTPAGGEIALWQRKR